ncbi:UPF0481 protein At3g47200 [Cucumis sativus]|uniref:Uncharacterized protein n=1 Tax=Cucumis sativus TaxID=3659 RepID=A0A0A0K6U9_CUCSA|nr:UPF0481 protein At3g47200 [Cucumis sativus]KGN44649.1 hypothetical protein Csa_016145 [Cucumis sativus]
MGIIAEIEGHDDQEMMENYKKAGFEDQEENNDDDVVVSIEKMFMKLPPINPKCFIYQVPELHRKMNDIAYTPQLISIGPLHHGQQQYKAAEQYKVYALKRYLSRINMTVGEAMDIAGRWEETARNCYANPIDMNREEFVKMMLLDSCFILEFMNSTVCRLRYWGQNEDHWMNDTLLCGLLFGLKRDLSMFENQLPFFPLQELFYLSFNRQNVTNPPSPIIFLTSMAHLFIATTGGYQLRCNVLDDTHKVRHLVDLLRFYYIPSPDTEEYKSYEAEKSSYINTPTISELCEAGVQIQRADDAKSLLDFNFKDGVLKIPPFNIHIEFEIQIRNLIVSEIFHDTDDSKFIFDYIALLDDLINTEKDVSILVKEKILTNEIGGSDEPVYKLINDLRLNAPTFPLAYYYSNMSKDLNEHCRKWWNRSLASLRRDYFNNPWASISFVAATVLLILTLLQTLFSAPAFFH